MKQFSFQLNVFQKPEAGMLQWKWHYLAVWKKFRNLSKTCSHRSEWCCQKTHVQDFWPNILTIEQVSEVNRSVIVQIFTRTTDNVEDDGLTEELHNSFSDRFYCSKHLTFVPVMFPISRNFPKGNKDNSKTFVFIMF